MSRISLERKDMETADFGTGQMIINGERFHPLIGETAQVALYHKSDGDINDKPIFIFVTVGSSTTGGDKIIEFYQYQQISLRMLAEAFDRLGYSLTPKTPSDDKE